MNPVLALSILLTIVSDTAYALIVGTLLVGRWLDVPEFAPQHSASAAEAFPAQARLRLLLVCTLAFVAAHIVRPWFLAASMSGSNNFSAGVALVPTILSSTHQGTLWYINSNALVVLLVGVLMTTSRSKRTGTWAIVVALAVIAFTKAASGHAADDGDFTLMEWSQFLHIIATAVWAGCVLVAGFLVLPRLAGHADATPLLSFGNRLSSTVTWALAALLISGIYTSDRELHNTLNGLWTSAWGKVLIAKVSFVLIAIALGASSRFLCLRHPASTSDRIALMARLMLSEAVVMVCILCLSGLLGNTAPAMSMT